MDPINTDQVQQDNFEKPSWAGKPVDQFWPWWPLLPLYPYGRRRTVFKELIPGQIWSFEQLQGLYYVAVPVRLTVVKVRDGLMLINPLPPTAEFRREIKSLEKKFGAVVSIVLPTASGLEHKIALPSLSRVYPNAEVWVCPGQWTFPLKLPSSWIGIPKSRTKTLFEDGLPHEESCGWISLGPIDIGLGRFQEVSCLHHATGTLMVTDAVVGIQSEPPSIFDLDPTPLLFHARDRGDQLLEDTSETRKKGWARVVLFASFLRPDVLRIPPLSTVLRNSLKPGLRNLRSHFGIYPFEWEEGWELSARQLLGEEKPLIQIAPVLERLVFPRTKELILTWLEDLSSMKNIVSLVPAHYSAPLRFSRREIIGLKKSIEKRVWATNKSNYKFLGSLDSALLKSGVIPKDPLASIKD